MTSIFDQKHNDEFAVDMFSIAMSEKMEEKRLQGFSGWDDPADCPIERLQDLLGKQFMKEHKDYVDIANFCMMIWNRELAEKKKK